LRKALAGGGSAEFRRQVEALLADCENQPTTAQEVKEMRAVWVLEEADTAAARECLEELAKGAPEARLTQEAKKARERVQRRARMR
jgi:anti-sigma factor RsiW